MIQATGLVLLKPIQREAAYVAVQGPGYDQFAVD